MFKFSLTSNNFNRLLKRLLTLSNNDKESIVTLQLDSKGKLEVFYGAKLDKGDSSLLVHEDLEPLEATGEGSVSFYLNNIFNIKLPDFNDEDKFPQCRSILFSVTKSKLEIKYSTKWSKESKETVTNFTYPVLEKDHSLDEYQKLFENNNSSSIEFTSKEFIEGINLCNFIKADVTSKEANGCLFSVIGDNYYFVNTDSDTAIKYSEFLTNINKKDINLVIGVSSLNAIKNFINDSELFTLTSIRNQLYVTTTGRTMLVPIMGRNYIIDNPEEFFQTTNDCIGEIELKPFLSLVSTLVSKSTDIYKKTELIFNNETLTVKTALDVIETLPSRVFSQQTILVNGSFILAACTKLATISPQTQVFYDSSSSRITLKTPNNRLVFLIQGLSL